MKRIVMVFFLVIFFLSPGKVNAQELAPDEYMEATVVKILDSHRIIEPDGLEHPYQKLELIGTSGRMRGEKLIVESGVVSQIGLVTYEPGDKVVLNVIQSPSGAIIKISDYVRRGPLYLLAFIFIALTILVGGRRGAFSIIGMGITFAILFLYILPQLSKGADPIATITLASVIIVPVTFCLSHGFNYKTYCAIAGTFLALIITGFLTFVFMEQTHLSGFASEEAGFLDVMKQGALDIKGLLFAGIIVALLGILEDITVSQAAIVFQLKKASSSLNAVSLFRRAMDVGRDHIASMANTLILVYAGASLPLLLLFVDNTLPLSSVINSEIVAEEIVRTLVASIGLILAVPITTVIASFAATIKTSNKV